MYKLILSMAILLILLSSSLDFYAQEEEKESIVELNPGVDLMSRFIWRGMNLGGSSPSIQPSLGLIIGNFEIGAWGAYSFGEFSTNQEFDLYASYTFIDDMFTIMLTDYFAVPNFNDYNYFDFSQDNTRHFYEGALIFNGSEKIPFTFTGAVIFYGADAVKMNDDPTSPDFNTSAGIQYSNYFELGYFRDIKDVSFNPFLGFTLNNPKEADPNTGYIGEIGFYGTGPGIINFGLTASKEIRITDKFALPLTASIITNPQAEKVYFVAGFSF